MNQKTQQSSKSAEDSIYVVNEVEDGYLVYESKRPETTFFVTKQDGEPTCSCDEFRVLGLQCAHIVATFPVLVDDVENVPETITFKRSVSPDGRIDSFSVEVACQERLSDELVCVQHGERVIVLQETLAQLFLERNEKREKGNGSSPQENGSEPCLGELLAVDGMDTRNGWRLFLVVRVEGQDLKLFGNREQLAGHIRAAGYPNLAKDITKGVTLDVPCRVVTRWSSDGKYRNVERLFPVQPVHRGGNGGTVHVDR
jgi:hypothetical protein